jgi:hypothetical protein
MGKTMTLICGVWSNLSSNTSYVNSSEAISGDKFTMSRFATINLLQRC